MSTDTDAPDDVPTPEELLESGEPLTPAIADAWSEAALERYTEQKEAGLRQSADERAAELSAEAEDAAAQLRGLAEDSAQTETVTLGGDPPVEITVRTELGGRAERELSAIDADTDIEDALETMLDVLCGREGTPYRGLIVAPEKFAARAAWRSVWEHHGSVFLFEQFEDLLAPAQRRMEDIESFRS